MDRYLTNLMKTGKVYCNENRFTGEKYNSQDQVISRIQEPTSSDLEDLLQRILFFLM
jgi:hypothetical protein